MEEIEEKNVFDEKHHPERMDDDLKDEEKYFLEIGDEKNILLKNIDEEENRDFEDEIFEGFDDS